MKLAIVLIAIVAGVWAVEPLVGEGLKKCPTVKKIVDHEVLIRQRDILRLLMHVDLPNVFEDQIQISKTFDIKSSMDLFTNPQIVKEFLLLYRTGLLKRGEIFTIYNLVHQKQAIALFKLFYTAKDFVTFYKTACWVRDHVNEGMFIYSLQMAILHRPDCKDLVLPPIYEILPHYFVNSEVMNKALKYKMTNFAYLEKNMVDDTIVGKKVYDHGVYHHEKIRNLVYPLYKHGDNELTWSHVPVDVAHWDKVHTTIGEKLNTVIIPANYTSALFDVDEDQRLAYLMEDVGLNSMFYYWHMLVPFWMNTTEYGLITEDHRGEWYHTNLKTLLARHYLERLSIGLDDIDIIDLRGQVEQMFVPYLSYPNGAGFPIREKTALHILESEDVLRVEYIEILEKRILDAIQSGIVFLPDGTKIDIYANNGIELLGALIEGNRDSPNFQFYYSLTGVLQYLVAKGRNWELDVKILPPSVLEHYETMLRDPAFWRIIKRVTYYMDLYKINLPTYTYSDLLIPGLKIEDVTVDKLVTYFDYFDIELNNGIYLDWIKEQDDIHTVIKARQMRLNHLPYNIRLNVVSEMPVKSFVRVFLGPKYDVQGRLISIEENRHNFIILDEFAYDIPVGKSVIERNSLDFGYTSVDRTSFITLYKKVMGAIEGKNDWVVDKKELLFGYPQRVMLPKGRRGGMEFQMFVMISPYVDDVEVQSCDDVVIRGGMSNPMFPLDRKIDLTVFNTPNMFWKDVTIFHKRLDEVVLLK